MVSMLESVDYEHTTISVGDWIEVLPEANIPRDDFNKFLLVTGILRVAGSEDLLWGLRAVRNTTFGALLPHQDNEITIFAETIANYTGHFFEQAQVTLPLDSYLRHRTVTLTDQDYPSLCSQGLQDADTGELVCRRIVIWEYMNAGKMNQQRKLPSLKRKPHGGCIRGLGASELDLSALLRRFIHKETPIITLSDRDDNAFEREISLLSIDGRSSPLNKTPASRKRELDPEPPSRQSKRPRNDVRKYRYADFYCGLGGSAMAAQKAGLEVIFGLDNNTDCCNSMAQNFPRAEICGEKAEEWLQKHRGGGGLKFQLKNVDVLHISAPCQFWSWPKTRPGQNDVANEASLYAVVALIRAVVPRLVTMEQTSGLAFKELNHPRFLAFIGDIHEQTGYSLAYKIGPLGEYGVPQTRERIIIFGSSTRAYSVKDALDNLVFCAPDDPLHDPLQARRVNEPPYDASTKQVGTICCNGATDCHPDGSRVFTVRELALLQGLIPCHIITGILGSMRKQIGNAVPTKAFVPFFKSCRQLLSDIDGGVDFPPCNIFDAGYAGIFIRNGNKHPDPTRQLYESAGPSNTPRQAAQRTPLRPLQLQTPGTSAHNPVRLTPEPAPQETPSHSRNRRNESLGPSTYLTPASNRRQNQASAPSTPEDTPSRTRNRHEASAGPSTHTHPPFPPLRRPLSSLSSRTLSNLPIPPPRFTDAQTQPARQVTRNRAERQPATTVILEDDDDEDAAAPVIDLTTGANTSGNARAGQRVREGKKKAKEPEMMMDAEVQQLSRWWDEISTGSADRDRDLGC
ncbi:S-adenosyl-L-methionine-dependent methyltransferase [Aulographum hederae CBS 113979]|uniref:DNA (cytosine-5-)-methyltransferase n=1 Tax=Aulographum hederae CBS 113979 TaxID=1176131 RepID=A0A6G1GTI3_9PEZI|nr:S-adenosyl-L-methionine-dependent methyltransferase [Aulographum hederae CBS 113979]